VPKIAIFIVFFVELQQINHTKKEPRCRPLIFQKSAKYYEDYFCEKPKHQNKPDKKDCYSDPKHPLYPWTSFFFQVIVFLLIGFVIHAENNQKNKIYEWP